MHKLAPHGKPLTSVPPPQDACRRRSCSGPSRGLHGAKRARVGRFEAATGGTLSLDEIDLSLAGQVKLLRVVQTGQLQRLGHSRSARPMCGCRRPTASLLAARRPAGLPAGPLLPAQRARAPRAARRRPAPRTCCRGRAFLELLPGIEGAPPAKLSDEARFTLQQYRVARERVRQWQNRIHRAKLTRRRLHRPAAATSAFPRRRARAAVTNRSRAATLRERGSGGLADAAAPSRRGNGCARRTHGGPRARGHRRSAAQAGGVVSKAAAGDGLSRQALYRRMERLGHRVRLPEGLTDPDPDAPDPGRVLATVAWLGVVSAYRRLRGRRFAAAAVAEAFVVAHARHRFRPARSLQAVAGTACSASRSANTQWPSCARNAEEVWLFGAPLQQAGRGAAHRAQRRAHQLRVLLETVLRPTLMAIVLCNEALRIMMRTARASCSATGASWTARHSPPPLAAPAALP